MNELEVRAREQTRHQGYSRYTASVLTDAGGLTVRMVDAADPGWYAEVTIPETTLWELAREVFTKRIAAMKE